MKQGNRKKLVERTRKVGRDSVGAGSIYFIEVYATNETEQYQSDKPYQRVDAN